MRRKLPLIIVSVASLWLLLGVAPAAAGTGEATAAVDTAISASSAAADTAADAPASSGDSAAAEKSALREPPDPSSLDVRLFRFLNGALVNPVLDAAMPVITDLDRWKIALLIVWAALVFFGGVRGRWASLVLLILIVASDQLSSSVFKPLFARIRPCEVLGGIHLWYGPEGWMTTPIEVARSYKSSFSCPSSHAANITASMLFLGLVYRRLIWPLMGIAVLVSFSRIYIGVHWPSDVAFGMVLGAALAWPAYLLFKRLERSAREHEERKKAPDEEPDLG